ncbi:DNA damage repair protein [Colletotrichum truncatum]|uniref:DNA damage repair protein n=1 Tax=Colletotrichum truncatum TaxID=5467 RepID=A0ACC3ZHC4_COLTU|nr:DNA damage repair protein [Colletotrichum truncatum]KAF6790599.1 DNA damage repair protein [Colletotrichum truncatum]
MTRSKSLAEAEKKALEGENDSQDSQFILDQYKTLYGIGVTSSSPPRPLSTSSKQTHRGSKRRRDPPSTVHSDPSSHAASQLIPQPIPSTAPSATGTGNVQDFVRDGLSVALPAVAATDTTGQDHRDPDPQITSASSVPIDPSDETNFLEPPLAPNLDGDAIDPLPASIPASCSVDEISGPLEKVNVPPRPSRPLSRKKVTMDVSQQSPTQDNDDRDYENYYDGPSFVQTSPISQDPATEHNTIPVDDSGVVNFGNLSHLIQDDTQVDEEPSSIPDDAAPATGRGHWRRSSSQQHSSLQRQDGEPLLPPTAPPPQTPAQPQNPFAGMQKLGDPALVGSQLFGQTQFSSAVKRFSPTSSRPSPHVYAHNSISPNIVETSPLKNRYNVTSPLVSSSPRAMRVEPTSRDNRDCSPSNSGPQDDGTVPESPEFAPVKARARAEPMDKYENMVDSQKRKLTSTESDGMLSGEDSDDMAVAMRRRRLAASKQEAAAKQLTSIGVGRRNARRSFDAPSATRKPKTPPKRYDTQRIEDDSAASDNDVNEFTVADSQGQTAAQQPYTTLSPDLAEPGGRAKPGLVSSNEAVPDSTGATQKSVPFTVVPDAESSGNSSRAKDLIPETSPNNTQSRPAARARASSDEPLMLPSSEAVKNTTPSPSAADKMKEIRVEESPNPDVIKSALPQPSRRSSRKPRPTLKAQSLNNAASANTSSMPTRAEEAGTTITNEVPTETPTARGPILIQSAPVPADSSAPENAPVTEEEPPLPSSPPILQPRAKSRQTSVIVGQEVEENKNPSTPYVPGSPTVEPPGSTSTLSVLTTTPVPSDKMSPATQESVELPPLSPGSSTRGRRTTKTLRTVTNGSRVAKPGTRRQVRRNTRLDSASTDELTRSPSVTGFENSMIQPPRHTARGSRLSMLSHTSRDSTGAKIFSGMVFAISFQSKKEGEKTDQYEHRLGQSRDIERMIVQAGGHLLDNGFDELFEPTALKSRSTSPASDTAEESPLTLTPWAQTLGFTALIADGHSRKVKYMQALALGLPCISDRWVATCVAKGAVVDWLPYLLCAGQSTFLRDAIRSRYLAPYPATEARLVDVVERRPKMLEGSKILLVMKKSRAEDKKMPYVFLAHVLGATLSRAYSLEEARDMLKNRELLSEPFDWVYVDEHTGNEEKLFITATSEPVPSKKRKRVAAFVQDDAAPPPKKIRTLSNELVIQSLILGRMIEEGELEA